MARLSVLNRSVESMRVLITGAASGMGRATARLFADEGSRVAVTDIHLEGAEAVASEIRDAGGVARAWKLDVAEAADIAGVIEAIESEFGGLDCLINNAGISLPTPIDAAQYEANWERTFEVLLKGQMRLIRKALPLLRKSDTPRIVNIASTEGLGATGGNSPYSSAKHGVIGLTRALAVELGKEGITVNCICPGPINTPMTARIPEEDKQKYARRRTALRRYGEPEEVAHATLNLCLPSSSFITGVALPVDGGLTIRRA
ncbi:SDR family oxidoreductase [Candidatus Sumerlaeota bacterium]|nr:SDR family oxidoreductase [Candidatus Sumerlaeota bacterium]